MKAESTIFSQQNQLLSESLQICIKNLLYQFKNDNYDGNKILRVVFQLVKGYPEGLDKEQIMSLWPDIELVVWNLSVSPKYWVEMFNQECFFSTDKDALDMHVFTNKIYKYVLEKAKKLTPHAVRITDMVSAQVFIFLEEVSMQICDCYERGRRIILEQTKTVQQLVKTSSIVNFYLLYKILLEISALCTNKVVQQLTTTLFRNIQVSFAEEFANYIIQKHEVLSLVFDNNSTKSTLDESLFDILERVKIQENVKWREALREDGESAIIVQFDGKDEQSAPDNYMIKMDKNGKLKVLNCNSLRMKWKITQAAEKNYDILNVVNDKNRLAQKLRNSPLKLKQVTLNDHFGTFGGALGKCLAQIKNFDSVGDFMFNLSKRSVINGTFNYVATNIPLIGIMFATGGYTYTIYSIFSNRIVSKKKKIQQVGFITVDMLSSFGSGMLGAVIGQSMIPIPFLGAFLGGMVGGFIGQLSASVITDKLQSRRFKKLIKQLQKSIQPGGYWEVNKNTLQIYNLDRQNFYSTIPEIFENRLGADKFWFGIISFTIMSFNQSKKRAEFIQTKAKKLSKQNDRKQNYQLLFQEIKQDLNYQPSIDIMCMIKYLQNNGICIISCYRELQEFIDKLFTRIH